jgi:hypothetical protein
MGQLIDRDDEWQRRATAAAITAARTLARGEQSVIPTKTPVGRLSDVEWGWIATAVIFAWISTRAEQASVEGLDVEQTVRMSGFDPNPWDSGAVAAILPRLAEVSGVDWSRPLSAWSRETMTVFLLSAFKLMREAMSARDLGGSITQSADAADEPILL